MKTVRVELPDGKVIEVEGVPDNVPAEQVAASYLKSANARNLDAPGAARNLKMAGSAAVQGVLDVPRMVTGFMKENAEALPFSGDLLKQDFTKADAALAGLQESIDVPAKTAAERWTKVGARGAGGAVGPGILRAPAATVASSVGAGLGSEGAAELLSDNAATRLGGAVVGGMIGGKSANAATRRLAPNTDTIAKELVEGVTPEDLARAQKVMEEVKAKYGISLDLSQALDVPSNVTAARDVLANSRYGNEVQRTLREQPRAAVGVMNTEVDELPGTVKPSMQQAANESQDAATQVLRNLKEERKGIVNPLYSEAVSLKGTGDALTSTIDEMLKQPLAAEVRRDLIRFRNDLSQTPWSSPNLPASERKATTFEEIDKLFKEFTGAYAPNPLNPKNAAAQADADRVAGELRGLLYEGTDKAKEASKLYRQFTEEQINPVKKGPIGRLATPRGAMPDREAAASTLTKIFDQGTDPKAQGTSEIMTLAKSFKQIDPSIFNDTAKTWLSSKLANAVKINEDGVIDPASMRNIKNALYTTPAQRQGIRDVLAGMADNSNLPRQRVVGAFEGYMDVLAKTTKRPETVGGLPQADIVKLAGKSGLADAIRFWGFTANMTAGRRIEERVLGKTMKELDKLLTTKEGVEYLQVLAQDGYVSPRAIVAGTTALAALRESQKTDETTEP